MKQEEITSAIAKWANGENRHALLISSERINDQDSYDLYLSEDPIVLLALVLASMTKDERLKWLITKAAEAYDVLDKGGEIDKIKSMF